jgi:mannose-6-phosphate isomerase-like protein (cupin superfamily)
MLAEVKKMKKVFLLALLVVPLVAFNSQAPAPSGFEHWRPADLQAASKALAEKAASDPHHAATKTLSDYPNDLFLLAHREADGQVELHETQADLFVVESGSATLIVGGTLLNGETVSPHEKRNGSIQDGTRHKLNAGDIVRIPANMPHQLVLDGGREFTYFVAKIKGY